MIYLFIGTDNKDSH